MSVRVTDYGAPTSNTLTFVRAHKRRTFSSRD
jgi:hypothetical protein